MRYCSKRIENSVKASRMLQKSKNGNFILRIVFQDLPTSPPLMKTLRARHDAPQSFKPSPVINKANTRQLFTPTKGETAALHYITEIEDDRIFNSNPRHIAHAMLSLQRSATSRSLRSSHSLLSRRSPMTINAIDLVAISGRKRGSSLLAPEVTFTPIADASA